MTARLTVAVLVAALLTAALPLRAETPVTEPDPEAYLRGVMANGRLRTTGTGEGFCWHAAAAASDFLDAYEAFGNPEWLAAAEKYYAFYIGKLQKDPDGYEGWIGDPISAEGAQLSTDAVVGDAILCEPLARFAWIVLTKEPDKLKSRFGKTAEEYVRLATRICWEKWNKRGCYYEDEAGLGSYHTHGKLVDLKSGKWVDAPTRVISDNLNKHYSISHVLLRLWRITNKAEYKYRVMSVYGRAKTMWRYYPDEDRVVWNFWMPHGPWDIEGRAPKSWVGVHPERSGYQAGEVADWVEVYDSGLVFERADLERIIRTNHWMVEGGTWRNADGTTDAGTLWTALARFDKQIRDQYEAGLKAKDTPGNRIRLAFLKNVTEKRLGFERLYCPEESKAEVVKTRLDSGRNITMSVVIPNRLELANDDRVQLACQTRAAGTLRIELLTGTGKPLGTVAEIQVDGKSQFNAPFFDGTNPATGKKETGEFLIRWTLGGESRMQGVWIVQGKRRTDGGVNALAAGQSVSEDFEGKLDPRWKLDRSEAGGEQVHGGNKSLKVNGQAELVFGRYEDLPVRVTMWIWDAGAKLGQNGNGPAWGVGTAMGDKFAVRQVWRKYLAGDREYSWLNTAQGQWFSPHPSGVPRKAGWSQWVFDFSDPKAAKVTGDGNAVRRLDARFTPSGAVSVFLMGSREGGPLYVDDIKVEYPAK
jgi:hypothetical protein